MPSSYTAVTLLQAGQALAQRLADPTQVHWTGLECQRYIQEALRTWGALTNGFRDTLTFNTAAFPTQSPFFDLGTVAPGLRGVTYTCQDAVYLLEYHLLEVLSTGTTWNGTLQYSYNDLLQAVTRRRDQFLLDTAAIVVRDSQTIAPAPDGRINLDQDIVMIRRIAWTTPDGVARPLQREDEWSANAYRPAWVQTPSTPRFWSCAVTEPLYIQMIPPPIDTGVLDLCFVQRGATLDPSTPLGVPNDWAWVVVFGALADLLQRDGLALDPIRARYAQARWTHGVQLAQQAPVVLTARLDNRTTRVVALPDADQFFRDWQTPTRATRMVCTLGQNLLAMSPAPNVNAPSGYAVTLDVVRNTPIPLASGQYLPIGPELLEPIYDYAQHLALLKEGPAELQASQALLDRFFETAGVRTSWQAALQLQRKALLAQQSQDRRGASPAHQTTTDITTGPAPGSTL